MTDIQTGSNSVAATAGRSAERAFSKSIIVSAVRCTLAYVLIPFAFPLIGLGAGVGPWIGIPVGVAALIANVVSIRRFQRSQHQWRWPMTVINVAIIGLVTVLLIADLVELFD
jgi:hypothetical protein